MQLTTLIFGLLVVVVFVEVPIHGSVMPFPIFRGNSNESVNAYNAQIDKNYLQWFQQILGQKPSTTTLKPLKPVACPPCTCGLTNTKHRIVGGVETKKNEYPWMAQLMRRGKFYCAASVISSRYVLTAAHCVARYNKDTITVRIGDHDRSSQNETEIQDFAVETLTRHSQYSSLNFDNDIAILKLKGVISFEGLMRPVCLAGEGPTYAGMKGIVTGWGATQVDGPVSSVLLGVTVPIMSNAECRSTKYPDERITDNMMCAGYAEGGKDSCQGDSGGPLHVVNESSKIHRLVGIVSWGDGCAAPNLPGVYTRVNRYLWWIKRNTPDACYCSDE